MQISKNFKLEEFYASDTAKAKGIDNSPTIDAVINIVRLCDNCMQKIRDHFAHPVVISSGYRCSKLNSAVGGVANSQHCKGAAADFSVSGYSISEVIQWCRNNLIFDQLINEKNQWVHISYNIFGNRKEVLKYDGKTYIKI